MKINRLAALFIAPAIILTTTAYAAPSSYDLIHTANLSILEQATPETAIPPSSSGMGQPYYDTDGTTLRWTFGSGSNPTNVVQAFYVDGKLRLTQNSPGTASQNRLLKAAYYSQITSIEKSNLVVEFTYTPDFTGAGDAANKYHYIRLGSSVGVDVHDKIFYTADKTPPAAVGASTVTVADLNTSTSPRYSMMPNEVGLIVFGGKVYYTSGAVAAEATALEIPGLTIEDGVTYYIRMDVDSASQTYDLYFSPQKIGVNTVPVLPDASLAHSSTPALPAILYFGIQKFTTQNARTEMLISDIKYYQYNPAAPDPDTSLKFYDDNGDVIEDLSRDTSYIDMLGDGNGSYILAAYKDNQLVNISIKTAAEGKVKSRFAFDYEDIDYVKIINLDDLASIQPAGGDVVTLEKE